MKKILILILALAMAVSALTACTYVPTVGSDVITMIVIDADAKVEIMVNPENRVASVTPLNDVAEILLSGESFIGKKPEEAASGIISIAAKAGLLSDTGRTTVKLSVTGDSDYAEVITKLVSKKMVKTMKNAGIKGSVEIVDPISEDDLRALCLENNYISEENAEYATYKYLLYTLATQRVGYASFPSEESRFVFRIFKDLDVELAMKRETLSDVETVKASFPETYEKYKSAVEAYLSLAEEFKTYCASTYLPADSDYQKALSAVRDSREDSDSAAAFTALDFAIKAEIEKYEKALSEKKAAVDGIESKFIDEIELERHLRSTYLDRQARVKTIISTCEADFKAEFSLELEAIKVELAARKTKMIG